MALESAMTQLVNMQVEKFITIVSKKYPHVPADELRELWAEMSGVPIDTAPVKESPAKKGGKAPQTGEKEKAPKKDSPSKKGNKTGYMLFGEENRKNIKEDNPEMTFGQVSKELGAMWKTLPSEEKAVYNDKAKNITEENHAHPTKGCNYVPVRGKSKGQECGKPVKEDGLCTAHCKVKSKPKPKQATVVSDSEPESSGSEEAPKKVVKKEVEKKPQAKPQAKPPMKKEPEKEREIPSEESEELEDSEEGNEEVKTTEVSEGEEEGNELGLEYSDPPSNSEEKSEKGSEGSGDEKKKEKEKKQDTCAEVMKGKRKGQLCGKALVKGVCPYHKGKN